MKNLIKDMNEEISIAQRKHLFTDEQIEMIAQARIAMQKGIVRLVFTKNDGTIRQVEHATTQSNIVKDTLKNSGLGRYLCVAPFYDLDEGGWRSFKWEKLISFEKVG